MTALLTCATVAEQLGVSRKTVLRWTAAGILPGFRLPGGALRFREDAIEAWLSERATPHAVGGSHLAEASPSR